MLLRVPSADGAMVAVTVYVIVLAEGIVTVSLMLPMPEAVLPVAPPLATEVNVMLVNAAGNMSAIVAPVTPRLPALVAVIV